MDLLQSETLNMLNGIFEAARLLPVRVTNTNVLPLTVISGFLGAGKTTLLNSLLSESHGRRLAVLVNDFGDINIDSALIRARSAAAISLANGCVCCTIAGGLTKALLQLSNGPEPPEAVILEASGLADPRGIAQVALANPAVHLDGVLTLVDGEFFEDTCANAQLLPILSAQISAADIIVLNKSELMGDRRGAVYSRLTELGGKRPIVEAVQANLPHDVVLGVRTQRSIAMACLPDEDHSAAFRSWSRVWQRPLRKDRLTRALEEIPEDIIRAKGIFYFSDNPSQRFVYQRVGPRWRLTPDDASDTGCESGLVVIGLSSKFDARIVSDGFSDAVLC